jgi:hypothetical protein
MAVSSSRPEADRPPPTWLGGSLFGSPIGLAVRRWCAPVLDLELHAGIGSGNAVRGYGLGT